MSDLQRLQSDFQNYLLRPKRGMEAYIVGTEEVSTEVRMGIYAEAYRLRLLEALETDYIALRALTGAEGFDTLGRAYIEAHPSAFFSIRYFGDRLSDFLAGNEPYSRSPWLGETAAFEWALTEVFDAADSPLVTVEDMAAVPPGDWPDMRLQPHASVRRLDLGWNVPAIWKAAKAGESLPPPKAGDYPRAWVLWRQGLENYFRSLEVDEAWALDALLAQRTFAEICAGLCEWVDEQNAPAHAAGLLKRWITDGLIQIALR